MLADKETGIGNYSDQDFLNAVQRGIRPDGTRLYPAMPFSTQSAEWNRGAYLAEALAHCGECHTPRNLALALDNRNKFAGALTAGWYAFNISSDNGSGIGAWSDDEVRNYLSTGHAAGRGTAAGPMGEAVDQSFKDIASSECPCAGSLCTKRPANRIARIAGQACAAGAEFAEAGKHDG